jgi:hypothetical protein
MLEILLGWLALSLTFGLWWVLLRRVGRWRGPR